MFSFQIFSAYFEEIDHQLIFNPFSKKVLREGDTRTFFYQKQFFFGFDILEVCVVLMDFLWSECIDDYVFLNLS